MLGNKTSPETRVNSKETVDKNTIKRMREKITRVWLCAGLTITLLMILISSTIANPGVEMKFKDRYFYYQIDVTGVKADTVDGIAIANLRQNPNVSKLCITELPEGSRSFSYIVGTDPEGVSYSFRYIVDSESGEISTIIEQVASWVYVNEQVGDDGSKTSALSTNQDSMKVGEVVGALPLHITVSYDGTTTAGPHKGITKPNQQSVLIEGQNCE
jgi:hypothetical protein